MKYQLSPPDSGVTCRQAGNKGLEGAFLAKKTAGRLGAQGMLAESAGPSAMVYELPVKDKLLEWQVGKQLAGGTGWLAEPTWFCCIKQSSLPCVCVCVWWVGVDCRQSVPDPGAVGTVRGLEQWGSST